MADVSFDKSSQYVKHPFWQWVVLYVAVGSVLYGFVYYIAMGRSGYSFSQSASAQISQQISSPAI